MKGPKIFGGASRLSEVSELAFKASERAASYAVKSKHLAGGPGKFAKFAADVDPSSLISEALRSSNAAFLRNTQGRSGFIVVPTWERRLVRRDKQR